MKDVARLAGVSLQTVSRVLNDSPRVRPDTRLRVLAAVQTLGYRRNSAARALVTGRTEVIGVVTMSGQLFGPASTLYGVEDAASRVGYFVSVVNVRQPSASGLRDAVGRLVQQGVDGVVVIAPLHLGEDELSGLAQEVPLVALEGAPQGRFSAVGVDQVLGAELATGHLLGLGHHTVWHVAGPADWLEAAGRTVGWRRTLAAAGAEEPPLLSGDWSGGSGYDAGQVLARIPEVTAVFAGNDQMALGVLRAMTEHGRRVPEEVSVVGFDDVPEAGFFCPPLTTVRQDFAEVGRLGVASLLEQVESGHSSHRRVLIPPALVVRQSSGPAR